MRLSQLNLFHLLICIISKVDIPLLSSQTKRLQWNRNVAIWLSPKNFYNKKY